MCMKEQEVRIGCDVHSIRLRFPFGAGSRAVRVYVTVRVTTCLTLTGRGRPDIGGSIIHRVLPSMYQLVGE